MKHCSFHVRGIAPAQGRHFPPDAGSQELWFGKPGHSHQNLLVHNAEKILLLNPINCRGGLRRVAKVTVQLELLHYFVYERKPHQFFQYIKIYAWLTH